MYEKSITVSFLNRYIKKSLDSDYILNNLSVKGEISNFKLHNSGHIYFSLKDDGSKINCVMFKSSAYTLKFNPKNGDKVVVQGRVSVYEKDGSYQLYCNTMKKDGIGDLYLAFEELKEKLTKEGLFDLEHKKDIPRYPQNIGIITSPTGAAIRDIINVSTRRNNKLNLLIYPSLVQGDKAHTTLVEGIEYFNKKKNVDVIILARGGGSIEELWAFNNESLAYAIYGSKIPVVTGVGHETDFTIVDFVSDRRAPTPSAAAEIVTPALSDILNNIKDKSDLLRSNMDRIFLEKSVALKSLEKELKLYSPEKYIVHQYEIVDSLKEKLLQKMQFKISMEKEILARYNSLLCAHNPLNILNKGYSIIESEEQKFIGSKEEIKKYEKISIRFKDGKVKANIKILEE
ncbi:Exodeoxyribonuclease VII large subunit [Clostridium collagenovorans DSM 3089]|uniref:Exodeoxyribonuclease 7 large subunit n=1 Tax=Clostridium collagenovorans DSM 3089 TaxID=1121306 RepID=A0A1M5T4B0_9CLOT|nr:exodeoxyribonuclease VII large subunit [Clostridium collagenovorans]SHH45591.1 Exodeoxyribonuclease VII large subunit [Clostridium collagenovorans DSM 3089]